MEDFKVICVNDRFKPNEFPSKFWIKKGEIYTITDAKFMANQNMSIGYKLHEISIPEDSKYQYFAANRFKPYSNKDEEAQIAVEELIKETLQMQEVN